MFRIVLVEPEIPNNTGCIGRTALGVGAELHLIRPLGFELDERAVRRAGLDYWSKVDVSVHEAFDDYVAKNPSRLIAFSSKSEKSLFDMRFEKGDSLIFGCESRGLPTDFAEGRDVQFCRIPISSEIRSLNLSTAVGIAVFEGVRQLEAR